MKQNNEISFVFFLKIFMNSILKIGMINKIELSLIKKEKPRNPEEKIKKYSKNRQNDY